LLDLPLSVRGASRAFPDASLPFGELQEVFMKKLVAFVFALLLVLGYAACGNGYSSPTAPRQAPGNEMTPTPTGGY
jgi:hypothetical protein